VRPNGTSIDRKGSPPFFLFVFFPRIARFAGKKRCFSDGIYFFSVASNFVLPFRKLRGTNCFNSWEVPQSENRHLHTSLQVAVV